MKAILKSESPKSCELIANGEKTMLLSKTRPKLETPFKGYIYCTSIKTVNLSDYIKMYRLTGGEIDYWHGKVIVEFVCDMVYQYTTTDIKEGCTITDEEMIKSSCLSFDELFKYENGGGSDSQFSYFGLYGLHISELKIYDKPKELGEFISICKTYNSQNDEKCWGCPNLRILDADEEDWIGDCISKHKPLTRPPASWCYVEEQ